THMRSWRRRPTQRAREGQFPDATRRSCSRGRAGIRVRAADTLALDETQKRHPGNPWPLDRRDEAEDRPVPGRSREDLLCAFDEHLLDGGVFPPLRGYGGLPRSPHSTELERRVLSPSADLEPIPSATILQRISAALQRICNDRNHEQPRIPANTLSRRPRT